MPAKVTLAGVTYKVTGIADNAFNSCTKLKSVTIGKNVTSIGTKAFYKCEKLTSVTIPAKVKTIGKQAFYNCSKLKKVTIQTRKLNKKSIGSKAFRGIYAKATIKVPKNKKKEYKKILLTKGVSTKAKIK